jgi:hypothetical protein
MAGLVKRMFELDAEHPALEPEITLGHIASTPHLRVTRTVKEAFQLLGAAKFRAVNFLAGKQELLQIRDPSCFPFPLCSVLSFCF